MLTMVNIALCDGNANDLGALRRSVNEYIGSRGFCGEALCFSEPGEVLRYSENHESVAVYILEVPMPETDSIELGKKLRERNKFSPIIYISRSREYALDAFAVHAFSYLIKPFTREKLFEDLDGCIKRNGLAPQKIPVKTADGIIILDLSEIVAVEYYAHRLTYHLTNGKIESVYRNHPFDVQAEELMKTGAFLKVSASYLVNLRNIRGIKAGEFVMCNGTQYKITRKYTAAKQQYINKDKNYKNY